jgi:hypothetical protein
MFTRVVFSGIVGMALTFSAGAYAGDLSLGGSKAAQSRLASNEGHFGGGGEVVGRGVNVKCRHWGCPERRHPVGSPH